MSILSYVLILLISAMMSGWSVFVLRIAKTPLKLLLAYSGAFLFALSLLHLIPELYEEEGEHAGIWILTGFLIQLLLEFISQGIEHGHAHIHSHEDHTHARIPWLMITGLCVHALLEGMPLGLEGDYEGFLPPFLTGIVLHNVPIAITMMIILMQAGATKLKASMILLLFAAMGPVGMLVTYFAGITLTEEWTPVYNAIIGVVIGIFLHISTTILFEASENHKFNAIRFISILAGVLTAWIMVH